jgi:hypothetical protein
MKRKWKRMTAAEGMAILKSDPEWVRQDAARKARHQARVAQMQKEMEPEHGPLLAELAAAGVKVRTSPAYQLGLEPSARTGREPAGVRSISDLVNTKDTYPGAIPILVKHLRTVRHPVMVISIARALTVKEARGTDAPRVILERLKQTEPCPSQSGDDYLARWSLANALTVVADKRMAEEIRVLAEDTRYQDLRASLEAALKNMGAG